MMLLLALFAWVLLGAWVLVGPRVLAHSLAWVDRTTREEGTGHRCPEHQHHA